MRAALVRLWLCAVAASSRSSAAASNPTITSRSELFVPGHDVPDLATYFRIPALASLNSTHVLAFAEARNKHVSIVMKVSVDGGANWSEALSVHQERDQKIGNPAPVVVNRTHVLLVYCRNNLKVFSTMLDTSKVPLNWSLPREITSMVIRPFLQSGSTLSFIASGPPGGIVLDSGRIVIGFDQMDKKASHDPQLKVTQSANIRTHIVYSDDHGETWHHTNALKTTGNFSCSENQVASTGGNTIITTARTQDDACRPDVVSYRSVSASADGGTTWTDMTPTDVVDPTCQGSTIGFGGNYYMSSGISPVPGLRANVSLSMCDTDCQDSGFVSWRQILNINPLNSSYSSLAVSDAGVLWLLYEVGGGVTTIKSLEFVTIAL